jgi:hypothetical protein
MGEVSIWNKIQGYRDKGEGKRSQLGASYESFSGDLEDILFFSSEIAFLME